MKKNPKSFLSKALAVALTVLMLVAASVLVVGAEGSGNVAKIGDAEYATLAKAIAAANTGDVIVLLDNVTETVTIKKAVTINGNGKTFTGQMVLQKNITVKNVNFVGQGYNGYAVVTEGATTVTIDTCTAKDYAYGFLNIKSSNDKTFVKNVTVSDVNYGIKVDRSNGVTLENVDITADVAAIYNSNYGAKTIAIKNSKLNIIKTWTRNETVKTNYVFEGENTVGEFQINAAVDNFKLALGATLTAPNDITATATEAGYSVKYENGKYVVKADMVAIGENTYASLAEAITAAQAGDTIVFLKDITENVTISKNINIDGADFTFTGKITINNNVEVTIENVNFVKGYIVYNNGNAAYGKLVVKNSSFVNGGYAIETAKVQSVTIEGCTVSGQSLLYARLSTQNILVKDTTVSGGNYGAHIVTGSKATFDNVKMTDMYCGILVQNVGAKTITIRNCEFSNAEVAEWDTKGTATDTYILEGTNIIPLLPDSNYAIIKLAKDAIVYANKAVYATVTTDVIGYTAIYNENDGAYELDVLKVDIVMTNIRMGETISHLFAVPFNKNIGEGHVAILTMGENEFEIPYSTTDWKVLTDENGTKYFVIEFTGIAAKQMVDEVSIYITFGTDTVSNKTVKTSVREYAMALLDRVDLEKEEDQKFATMLVDMLNYGAAAQVYFDYKKDDLANNGLEEEQQVLSAYEACQSEEHNKHAQVYDKHFMGTSVRFENAITLVFKVYVPEAQEDISKISATFDITGEVVEIREDEDKANNPHVYYIELTSLVVTDAHQNVTCTVTVGGVDLFTVTDSVAGYAARRLNAVKVDSAAANLYTAFMNFADSAIAYKGN